ncbi:alpha/beta fold hydrolase [Pseudoflavitalea rhizosphaerae]|uniref:alpha/beta fold hydrolase n=1 Tax=Pseudoflavitalea rhizosphaerae TaxID=1884793 RepID=UPI000F8F6A6A|nr:alpha/beta fold hydrolase [Pseudoflavitalea rhizosphaerae]
MKSIVLLHGATGAASQLQPLADALSKTYSVHIINFSGHGGEPMPGEDFSIELFAKQVLSFFDEHQLQSPIVFGYSLGGYVGMYIARHHPGRISKLITLATKFHWDEAIAAKQQRSFDANVILEKAPAFAEQLKQMHAPNDWKEVLSKTGAMLTALGNRNSLVIEDYPQVQTEILLVQGDKDRMVTLEETIAVYRALPANSARLCVLPGTPHPLEQVDLNLLVMLIG